jgi:Leucine-rich repeat (LRR) protein
MSDLQTLHLSNTRVTDAGLQKLVELKKLNYMHLNGLPLTDDAVNSLLKLKSLSILELNGTKITPAGFDRLTAAGVKIWNRR